MIVTCQMIVLQGELSRIYKFTHTRYETVKSDSHTKSDFRDTFLVPAHLD